MDDELFQVICVDVKNCLGGAERVFAWTIFVDFPIILLTYSRNAFEKEKAADIK